MRSCILTTLAIVQCALSQVLLTPEDVVLYAFFTTGWWGNLPNKDFACILNAEDPASWQASGAADLVKKWISVNGEADWLVNLQKNITAGDQSPNFLDCTKLGANTCTPPEKSCFDYNPPAHYFVRIAAARANDFFDQANTALLGATIDNLLSLDPLLEDFGPEIAGSKDKDYRIASASLSVAEKVLKQIPIVGSFGGDFLGLMSATTALIGLTTGPTVIDVANIKADITEQLRQIFVQTELNLDRMNNKLLNGAGDLDLNLVMDILRNMRGSAFSEGDASGIAKIMEGGAFLVPTEAATAIGGVREGMNTIKQGIIGSILRGTGYFVYVQDAPACGISTENPPEEYNTYGFQMIDGKCFGLWLQHGGGLSTAENRIYDKMQEYGINTIDFYRNVVECQNGEIGDHEYLGEASKYQKCFFSLRIWEGKKQDPCEEDGWKNFPELRLSDAICHAPKSKCGRICWRGTDRFDTRVAEIGSPIEAYARISVTA